MSQTGASTGFWFAGPFDRQGSGTAPPAFRLLFVGWRRTVSLAISAKATIVGDMDANFWKDCLQVETIPGKLNGMPAVRNARVEADLIPESLDLGLTAEEIAEVYSLNLKDVLGIRDYYLAHVDSPAPVG